jgi:hypothetical protein
MDLCSFFLIKLAVFLPAAGLKPDTMIRYDLAELIISDLSHRTRISVLKSLPFCRSLFLPQNCICSIWKVVSASGNSWYDYFSITFQLDPLPKYFIDQ